MWSCTYIARVQCSDTMIWHTFCTCLTFTPASKLWDCKSQHLWRWIIVWKPIRWFLWENLRLHSNSRESALEHQKHHHYHHHHKHHHHHKLHHLVQRHQYQHRHYHQSHKSVVLTVKQFNNVSKYPPSKRARLHKNTKTLLTRRNNIKHSNVCTH